MNKAAHFIPFSRELISKTLDEIKNTSSKDINKQNVLNTADELLLKDPDLKKVVKQISDDIQSDHPVVQIFRGIIRPTVTILLTGAFVYLVLLLGADDVKEAITIFLAVYGPILGFWFGQQTALKSPVVTGESK